MEADEGIGIIMKNRTERIIEEENKMKTIGLLGGMSWESTVTYYQVITGTAKRIAESQHLNHKSGRKDSNCSIG